MNHIKDVDEAVAILQKDHTNGARVLATNALIGLRAIITSEKSEPASTEQLWQQCRVAGYRLSQARPSMSAAITSTITNALSSIQEAWNDQTARDHADIGSIRRLIVATLDRLIGEREQSSERLAEAFLNYLSGLPSAKKGQVRLLTLSSSSSLKACLYRMATALRDVNFIVYVLESRPAMEGATFASQHIKELHDRHQNSNVKIVIAPDSHVCTFAKDIDILLLGADRVSGEGDVSNKMGSLSAALATKSLSHADVVIVTESDKIARPGALDEHKDEDNDTEDVSKLWPQDIQEHIEALEPRRVQIRNVYFEWVPKQYVDVYVTEEGLFDTQKIRAVSQRKAELEDTFFDEDIVKIAQQAGSL